MKTITREALKKRIDEEKPDNLDKKNGYALVNVLSSESFLTEHIPGSINILKGNESEFGLHFDRAKEIIVYCGSPDCHASTKVATELEEQGFENIIDYEGGMSDWKEGAYQMERGESGVREIPIA